MKWYGFFRKRKSMAFYGLLGHFMDFFRAFYGLLKGVLRTFFGYFTDFSVDCMTNYKTKKVQQHQDSNHRPLAPKPNTLTTALLIHMENSPKTGMK
jgi:hypothetical protein